MSVVTGKLIPIKDNVLITDMTFDEQKTASGIVILSDDGKTVLELLHCNRLSEISK